MVSVVSDTLSDLVRLICGPALTVRPLISTLVVLVLLCWPARGRARANDRKKKYRLTIPA
jgi:hypothetical protein